MFRSARVCSWRREMHRRAACPTVCISRSASQRPFATVTSFKILRLLPPVKSNSSLAVFYVFDKAGLFPCVGFIGLSPKTEKERQVVVASRPKVAPRSEMMYWSSTPLSVETRTTLFCISSRSQLVKKTIIIFKPCSSFEPTNGLSFHFQMSSRFAFLGRASRRTFSNVPLVGIVDLRNEIVDLSLIAEAI